MACGQWWTEASARVRAGRTGQQYESSTLHLHFKWASTVHLYLKWPSTLHLYLKWISTVHLYLKWISTAHLYLKWASTLHLFFKWASTKNFYCKATMGGAVWVFIKTNEFQAGGPGHPQVPERHWMCRCLPCLFTTFRSVHSRTFWSDF